MTDTASAAAVSPSPARVGRSALRSIAVPTEHGGWGLTAEPVVLGLAVAPSIAGLCLGSAAIIAFLARTGFLPRFGFPVDVVRLETQWHEKRRERESDSSATPRRFQTAF